jgi:hypothetical protein
VTNDQLQEFARVGAEARLRAILKERDAIMRAFPDVGRAAAPGSASVDGDAPRGRKRSGMSPAQRKAVGERMRAYWAKRRAKRGQTAKKSAAKSNRKRGMSAEARKAVGERMRAYWAKRRQQKAGTAEGPQGEAATANGSGKSTGKASQKRRSK